MADLRAGSLNRRIVIEQQTQEQDNSGQQLATWEPVHSCFASLSIASSKEVYAAAGFVQQISHVIRVRWTPTPIRNSMRVRYGSRLYDVQAAVDPDESRVLLVLYCLERDA